MTAFSYSGRVKPPEWRRQRRRADLRHFEIFRQGPIVIYTRLPAGGTCYPICMFPTKSECLIDISDAFSAFCLLVTVIFTTCSLYPQQKRAYSAQHVNMCLSSTETIRLIRDGEKGGSGMEVGEGGRICTYRYTVTTRMTRALRWAVMRAILMFH